MRPHYFFDRRIQVHDLRDLVARPGIKLLNSNQRDMRSALHHEIVVNLPGAKDESRDRLTIVRCNRIIYYRIEGSARQIADLRCGLRQTQQTFGLHQNQRPSLVQLRLSPQNVEVLRRGRWICHALISFGTQLQKSFKTGTRVFGALPLISMWKQQHYRRVLAPLCAIGGDELVDDRLGDVHKIAVLRFPKHQRILGRSAVPVLEAKHCCLREWTIVDLDPAPGLAIGQMLERNVDLSRLRIVEHRLSMGKRCALSVLTSEPHRCTFGEQ